MNNLIKYKNDLDLLIKQGDDILMAMKIECGIMDKIKIKKTGDEYSEMLNKLINYQTWYSEAMSIIRLILPERIDNFIQFYEGSKNRKTIDNESYVIKDFLLGITLKRSHLGQKIMVVDRSAAIKKLEQQVLILKACNRRFESSLFNIKQLLLADVFDLEIDVAKELNKKGFYRASGAIVGVVLESHFLQVCKNHNITMTKKNHTINDYNELLKQNEIIDIKTFRYIQFLGDIRNKCDHKKEQDPTKDDIIELINGAEKIIKTIF